MKAHSASLLNAVILIVISAWAYLASATGSLTALVPAAFGIALIACYPGVKAENKLIAHVAVVLTLIVFVALFMPLMRAFDRGDTLAIIRLLIMQISTAVALLLFIRSFIEARRRGPA